MNIKITTDSTVDIPDELLHKNDIDIAHFGVALGDQLLIDRVDCTPDTIYEFVAREKRLPKTSAVNYQSMVDMFSLHVDNYDHIIHISLSSGISLAYENAVMAAREFSNVSVVDGRTLSTGTALLVLYAKELADSGKTPEVIISCLNDVKNYLQVSFVVDTMEYLYKGGRCSGLAAFIASKLSIKPTIIMAPDIGKMKTGKKYLASSSKAILKYVDDTFDRCPTPDLRRIFITHTSCDPEIVTAVRQKIAARFPFKEIIETIAGSTITSHCGRGTLGILYINKQLD